MHLSIRILPLLLTFIAACESREIYVPPPKQLEPQACAAAPAPEAPVCPAPVVCPAPAPEVQCPAPVVCPPPPAPPGPIDLRVTATALEPLRAQIRIAWSVQGCTAAGLELLGEAGQVFNLDSTSGGTVDVINLTRDGSPIVERFGFWARVTCTDQRTHVAGPYIITNALRATQVTTLDFPAAEYFLQHLGALPGGGWHVMTGRIASNYPSITNDTVWVFSASGARINETSMRDHPTGTVRTDHPWVQGTRVYFAPIPDALRGWIDYTTGAEQSAYVLLEPTPAAAYTTYPIPAELAGHFSVVAPSLDNPRRVWVARDRQVGLIELSR